MYGTWRILRRPRIDVWRLSIVTMIQGAGISLIFIPAAGGGFRRRLDPALRNPMRPRSISLSRSVGSAIGVSATSRPLLTSNIQTCTRNMPQQVTPFNRRGVADGSGGSLPSAR
jgi:hypothetical protein